MKSLITIAATFAFLSVASGNMPWILFQVRKAQNLENNRHNVHNDLSHFLGKGKSRLGQKFCKRRHHLLWLSKAIEPD
jgi:hypothetical protein